MLRRLFFPKTTTGIGLSATASGNFCEMSGAAEASQPIPATIKQMAAALRPPIRIIALSPLGLARRQFDWHETLRRLNLNRIHALRKQKGKNQSGFAPVKSIATAC